MRDSALKTTGQNQAATHLGILDQTRNKSQGQLSPNVLTKYQSYID